MIGNTLLGLIFTRVLYVVIQTVTEKLFGAAPKPAPAAPPPEAAHPA
ncbi:MAG: hypothetical protein LW650_14885 [Planctomycetaceae bacterium]|jgi:hypothetical protein|nr:hypothetical protein [Planctomycetaceae bacterium]